jgi:A/G-specific adenine glycosylase
MLMKRGNVARAAELAGQTAIATCKDPNPKEILGMAHYVSWSGLGYNRRALNLQKAAQVIVQDGRDEFPTSVAELMKLPGVGEYTASAVACFAHGAQIPVIDTNIRKVITSEFFNGVMPDEKIIGSTAQEILPKGKAKDWNQALMDYSSLVLKSVKIPIAKQSHFRSSDRWYRGQIIMLLLDVKVISLSGLLDYFSNKNPIDQERLEAILLKLSKDDLIIYEDRTASMRQ